MEERESVGEQLITGLGLALGSVVLGRIVMVLQGVFETAVADIGGTPYHQLRMLEDKWSHSAAAVDPRFTEPSWIPLEWRCFVTSVVILLPIAALAVGFASGVCRLRRGAAFGAGIVAVIWLYAAPSPETVTHVGTCMRLVSVALLSAALGWFGNVLGRRLVVGVTKRLSHNEADTVESRIS